ncbi:hypothetical protein DPMN_052050 [Dreissena polymorpha]|uniref:Uncharacterized protein n=1 Tax=Dreissena polymorpha TaxID=45954 RepID=A0A9D4HQW1_DREPO|nr:hypothetical protein DPMN_052050 [Dreissena polymorpha]
MLATETTTRKQATNGARSEADQATGLMKDGDQSRKDVPCPIAELLTPSDGSEFDVGKREHSTRLES